MTSSGITRLGRYEILGRIATGGMATVYLARLGGKGGFAREFALKVVHPHLACQPGFAKRFQEEARLAARVRHPNAVSTVDAGEDEGYSYLVLDFIDGVSLRQLLLHRSLPLSGVQAAGVVCQVAQGLHALHTATDENGEMLGIVHRDLSPHNIMLERDGRAILIDLGLAKAANGEALTQTGVLAGKLPYMSPEHARFEPMDARSDVFSLGTVLFELCTGSPPFGDDHTAKTLRRVQHCELDHAREILDTQEIPTWVAEIILVCLQADPDKRFGSAKELSDAISQELQRHGRDLATVRRTMAELVAEAAPTLSVVDPATSLPIRIAASDEGGTGQVFRPLRWVAIGAAAALLALGAVQLAGVLGPTDAAPDRTTSRTDSLAADQVPDAVHDSAAIQSDPARAPGTAPRRPGEAEPEAVETDGFADEAALIGPLPPEVPTHRIRRRAAELKPNPYAP